MKVVTELLLTPFGLPHPYELHFVAQYRFVFQTGEFLVRRNDTQQIVGGLAKSWTISQDRKKIVFHLRPDIYTAEETAQSLRRLITAGQTSHSNFTSQIIRLNPIDALNLEIETRGDAAGILMPLVMADAVILPDDHWTRDASGKEQVDWRKTKGPYIWESGSFPLKVGSEVVYAPNPKHYSFDAAQFGWRMKSVDMSLIESESQLREILSRDPSYCTLRYSNLLRAFSSPDPNLKYFQTKPSGIAFIQLNRNSSVFRSRDSRRAILKKVFASSFNPLLADLRAYQIPQPGLTGRLSKKEESELRSEVARAPDHSFNREIVWSVPGKIEENTDWHKQLVESLKVPVKFVRETVFPMDKRWKNGEIDATFLSTGMSDTDPISSATFLFSPSGANADFEDGRIMNILNTAKLSKEPAAVYDKIREAFKTALQEGFVVPLYYTVNRHYHSANVELNVSDPFAEQVHAGQVRIHELC